MDEHDRINLYEGAAQFYDLDNRAFANQDMVFYLDRASPVGGHILDLACGTGRVTIPLAQAGYVVTGIELSADMLVQFRAKLLGLPAEVAGRINLIQGDMCNFDLGREFSLVIIPGRSFQGLTTEEQQRGCLASVRRHLASDGRFILNVVRMDKPLDASWVQPQAIGWENVDPKTSNRIRKTHIRRQIDVDNQLLYVDETYYVEKPDGTQESVLNPLILKYYYEDQLRQLLKFAGFTISEEMGWWDGRPLNEGRDMIFVCSK